MGYPTGRKQITVGGKWKLKQICSTQTCRDIYKEILKNLGYYIPDNEDSYEFLQLIATNDEISQYTELLLNDLL